MSPNTTLGYNSFRLDNIKVKIDTSSIGKDTIVIKEILINAPDVIAEFKDFPFNITDAKGSIQKALKSSNFIAIQNNVDAFVKQSGGASGGKSSGGSAAPAKEGDEPKLIIEKFRMTGVKVRVVSHKGLVLDKSLAPFSISLDNIGKKEGGLKPAEIAAVLIPKVQDAVVNGMTGDLIKSASEVFKNMGGTVKDAVGGVTKALGGATGGAGSAVGDAAKGATDGLKKLFGK